MHSSKPTGGACCLVVNQKHGVINQLNGRGLKKIRTLVLQTYNPLILKFLDPRLKLRADFHLSSENPPEDAARLGGGWQREFGLERWRGLLDNVAPLFMQMLNI